MQQHLDLMRKILEKGHDHSDRTGVGRRSLFGEQIRFNLEDGFPLTTTRHINTRAIIEELLWFISGSSDNTELREKNVGIWSKWTVTSENVEEFLQKYNEQIHGADKNIGSSEEAETYLRTKVGSVGHMYGEAWRNVPNLMAHALWPNQNLDDVAEDKLAKVTEEWNALGIFLTNNPSLLDTQQVPTKEEFFQTKLYENVDQLNDLLINLRDRPYSSRHVVSAWIPQWIPFETLSPAENVLLEKGALAPCHTLFQCFVTPPQGNPDTALPKLSMQLYLRSSDVPVGLSFNIAQYAILLTMIAQVSQMEPYELIITFGDCHIYLDQIELVKEQLIRQPLPLPTLWVDPMQTSLYGFDRNQIIINNYNYHEAINYPVAV